MYDRRPLHYRISSLLIVSYKYNIDKHKSSIKKIFNWIKCTFSEKNVSLQEKNEAKKISKEVVTKNAGGRKGNKEKEKPKPKPPKSQLTLI